MDYPGTWVMTQTWEQLLFLHWKITSQYMDLLLPKELELDTYQGSAWLTVLPFQVSHQRIRLLPELPLLRAYRELNVRTYVKYKGKPGVYFFSLDVDHPLAVIGGKTAGLPFHLAKIDLHQNGSLVSFTSSRMFKQGAFSAEYAPISKPVPVEAGSLDYWLLERYSLFVKFGKLVLQGDIRHEHWEVSRASVRIMENSILPFKVVSEPEQMHFCARKTAYIFPFRRVPMGRAF